MDFGADLIEYYDELFPLDKDLVEFCKSIRGDVAKSINKNNFLCRVLEVGCRTGRLTRSLVQEEFDVTGIDESAEMIETAVRRKKVPYTDSRFYKMTPVEMNRYLYAGSFHIGLCLRDTLPLIADKTLIRKFLYDMRNLILPGGKLAIQITNYAVSKESRVVSPRVQLTRSVSFRDAGEPAEAEYTFEFLSSNKRPARAAAALYPLSRNDLKAMTEEAGFKEDAWYSSFNKDPASDESPNLIGVFG